MSCIYRGVRSPFHTHNTACGLECIPEQFIFQIIITWLHSLEETNLATINKAHLRKMFYTYVFTNLGMFIYSALPNLCVSKTLFASLTVVRQPILTVQLCYNFHCISIYYYNCSELQPMIVNSWHEKELFSCHIINEHTFQQFSPWVFCKENES